MTPEAHEALKSSVAAWEHKLKIVQTGELSEIKQILFSCAACPLCRYAGRNCEDVIHSEKDCLTKCPVAFATQSPYCIGTPYLKARDAWWKHYENPSKIARTNLTNAITDEINFLKSLLPKD